MYPSFGSDEAAATSRAVCASPARMEDGCHPENGLWEPQQGVNNSFAGGKSLMQWQNWPVSAWDILYMYIQLIHFG